MSRKVIKGSMIVDFLVDRAVEDYEPVKFDFLNKNLMVILQVKKEPTEENCWKLHLGHGISAVLISLEGKYCPFMVRLDFDCTNNMAKYAKSTMGL